MKITAVEGDITQQDVDVIVNAANHGLLGGGGVDGAIHRAAGPELVNATRALPQSHGVRCPTGEARITPGFRLKARYVVHTVGPIYARDPSPAQSLRRALQSSLALASAHGAKTIAVPAISCGVYGYPLEEAAEILVEAAHAASGFDEIRFVLYGDRTYQAFTAAIARRQKS